MRRTIFIFSLIFLAASCNQQAAKPEIAAPAYNYTHKLQVGSQTLMVETASTTEAMQKGLSDRSSMNDDQGMLFDYGGVSSIPAYWMKDMKFNLDFIWIYQNKIIGITPDVPAPKSAEDNLPSYYPPSPVDEVLEVNAGWEEMNNIKIGDDIFLSK